MNFFLAQNVTFFHARWEIEFVDGVQIFFCLDHHAHQVVWLVRIQCIIGYVPDHCRLVVMESLASICFKL